jgi:ATPase subunit of ABC transporter with duplicated ATPase domains
MPSPEHFPSRLGRPAAYLARFLFRGDDVLKEVRMLSGGERSRLELALLGILPSNLLLLDEPTNHLDIPAREALEAFLRDSPATVLLVSHDRRLLETLCDRLWVVDAGLVAPFEADTGRGERRSGRADGPRASRPVQAAADERSRAAGKAAISTARRNVPPAWVRRPAGARAGQSRHQRKRRRRPG